VRERQESGSSQCSDIDFDGMFFWLNHKTTYVIIYI
jgi:hypothetical protein